MQNLKQKLIKKTMHISMEEEKHGAHFAHFEKWTNYPTLFEMDGSFNIHWHTTIFRVYSVFVSNK